MVSTSMHYVPGCPILESADLVNWSMVGYAVDRYDEDPRYDMQGGTLYLNGAWASSLRHHNGKFYVAFCTPYGWGTEHGHFNLCEAERPEGPWKKTVFDEYMYDPGLFFDDDGRAYVIHGQGTLLLTELTDDLHGVAAPPVEIWNQRFNENRECGKGGYGVEGSHVYKKDGYYYILCPAGGTEGWQVCLRSKNIRGPYEHRIILDDDGSYPGNGLHQGGMVELEDGSWWAVIMQDRGPIGRVPCLLPVTWTDGWPILGAGGQDAITYAKPALKEERRRRKVATSDNFDKPTLGLQWQWNHNPDHERWSLEEHPGRLRLRPSEAKDLTEARNTLTQRVQGPMSEATAEMELQGLTDGMTAGFGIFKIPYAYLAVRQREGQRELVMCNAGETVDSIPIAAKQERIWLRAYTTEHEFSARFTYSLDGLHFIPLGNILKMGLGLSWTANRFALFCFSEPMEQREQSQACLTMPSRDRGRRSQPGCGAEGYVDFNAFQFNGR